MNFYDIIIQQLGGQGRLKAMIGASAYVYDEKQQSLRFQFKGCKTANICKITLLPSDTYQVELFKFSPKKVDCTPTFNREMVYCDQLRTVFERATGLYLSI
jgi:hypothetical protein